MEEIGWLRLAIGVSKDAGGEAEFDCVVLAIENPLEDTHRRSWIHSPLLNLLCLIFPSVCSGLSVGNAVFQGRADTHKLRTDFRSQRGIFLDSCGGRVTDHSLDCFLVPGFGVVSLKHDVPVATSNL